MAYFGTKQMIIVLGQSIALGRIRALSRVDNHRYPLPLVVDVEWLDFPWPFLHLPPLDDWKNEHRPHALSRGLSVWRNRNTRAICSEMSFSVWNLRDDRDVAQRHH